MQCILYAISGLQRWTVDVNQNGRLKTMRHIDNVIAANRTAGGTFFNSRTVLYFKNKVLPTMYGGKYFISYDLMDDGTKLYSVRQALSSGLIKLVGERHAYVTEAAAKDAIRALLNDMVTA
jgi:hypothetical protein